MATIDLVAIWVGRGVLLAGALGLAVCLVAGLNALMGALFWAYARKIGFTVHNWDAVHRWDQNGRPEWHQGSDNVFRMVPTAGNFEESSHG